MRHMKHLPIYTETFKRMHTGFTRWIEDLGYCPQEVSNNSSRLREFLHFLENRGIQSAEKITAVTAAEYLQYISLRLRHDGNGALSPNYRNKHINTLHHLGRYLRLVCHRGSDLHFCYYDYEKARGESLSTEEIALLYKAAAQAKYQARDRAILAVFYGCGLRRGEGVALELSDLLFARGLVHVRKGKNYRERFVPVSGQVKADLRNYIRSHRRQCLQNTQAGSERLFINNFGRPMTGSGLFKNFCRLVSQTGDFLLIDKKPGLHTLRHSIATHLLESGMDIEYVCRFLGHRSLTSTQVYTHLKKQS